MHGLRNYNFDHSHRSQQQIVVDILPQQYTKPSTPPPSPTGKGELDCQRAFGLLCQQNIESFEWNVKSCPRKRTNIFGATKKVKAQIFRRAPSVVAYAQFNASRCHHTHTHTYVHSGILPDTSFHSWHNCLPFCLLFYLFVLCNVWHRTHRPNHVCINLLFVYLDVKRKIVPLSLISFFFVTTLHSWSNIGWFNQIEISNIDERVTAAEWKWTSKINKSELNLNATERIDVNLCLDVPLDLGVIQMTKFNRLPWFWGGSHRNLVARPLSRIYLYSTIDSNINIRVYSDTGSHTNIIHTQ